MRRPRALALLISVVAVLAATLLNPLAPAPMAQAAGSIVQKTNVEGTSLGFAKAYTSNVAANNLLVALLVERGGSSPGGSAPTDTLGNTWTQRLGYFGGSSNQDAVFAWSAPSGASGGADTVTINETMTGVVQAHLFLFELHDTSIQPAYDANSSGTQQAKGSGTSPTAAVTTVAANTLILGIVADDATGATTMTPPGTPWTTQDTISNGTSDIASSTISQIVTSASTYSATWTTSSLNYVGGLVSFTVTAAGSTAIAPNAAGLFYSPYNWYRNGSSYAETVNPGAYVKFAFTGTSLTINVDVTPLSGASAPAISYPALYVSIDGGQWSTVNLTSSSSAVSLASALAGGTHYAFVGYKGAEGMNGINNVDRWTTPVQMVKVTGFTLDGSSSVSALTPSSPWYPVRPKNMIEFGYSNLEGVYADYDSQHNNAFNTAGWDLCAAFNAECGIIGFGSQSWTTTVATANVPGLRNTGARNADTSWDKYFAGQSRLTGGMFSPQPDYGWVMMGGNDASTADATITANTRGFVNDMATAAPSTTWFMYTSYGYNRAKLNADMGTGAVSYPGNWHFLDTGAELADGTSGTGTSFQTNPQDGLHGNVQTQGWAAALLVQQMESALVGSGGGHPHIGGGLSG